MWFMRFSDDSKHSYDVKVHIVPHSTTLGLKSARISTVFDIRSYEPLVVSSFYIQMALIFDTLSKCLCCFSKRKVWCPTCLVVVKKWQHLSTSNLGATTSSRCFESSPSASRNRFGWIQVSGAWSSHDFLAVAILAFEFHLFLCRYIVGAGPEHNFFYDSGFKETSRSLFTGISVEYWLESLYIIAFTTTMMLLKETV